MSDDGRASYARAREGPPVSRAANGDVGMHLRDRSAAPPASSSASPPAAPPVSRSLLVVEDDEPIRRMMAQALAAEGYSVVAAGDGAEALDLLGAGTVVPRLILLDWRMPTPGDVFARAYRKQPGPHAPIVVLTAAGDAVSAAVEIEAQGFLRKPFDLVGRFAGPPGSAVA